MIWYDTIWYECIFITGSSTGITTGILSIIIFFLSLCPLLSVPYLLTRSLSFFLSVCLSVCLFHYFIIVKDSYKISYDFLTSKVKLNLIISNTRTRTPSLNTPYPGSPLPSPPKPTQVWSLANSPSKFCFHLHWHLRFIYIQISFIFSVFFGTWQRSQRGGINTKKIQFFQWCWSCGHCRAVYDVSYRVVSYRVVPHRIVLCVNKCIRNWFHLFIGIVFVMLKSSLFLSFLPSILLSFFPSFLPF